MIEIDRVQGDVPQLSRLLRDWPFPPYRSRRDTSPAAVRELVLARVGRSMSGPQVRSWTATRERHLRGLAILQPLEWDSQVLEMRAAKLDLLTAADADAVDIVGHLIDAAVADARRLEIQHLSVRVDAADDAAVHALETRGFLNIDALVTFSATVDRLRCERGADVSLRVASRADTAAVSEIAGASFQLGRFHSDPALPPGRASAVYRAWAAGCCEGKAADHVILAEAHGQVHGFIACRIDPDTAVYLQHPTGTIPLIASTTSGRGIGATLIGGAADWFRRHAVESVEVGTQLRNIPAARLYERCGFRVAAGSLSFRRIIHA
ncbi:MAG: GNAT family N-acetyltransferase [Vicinamibacterales bacterium]